MNSLKQFAAVASVYAELQNVLVRSWATSKAKADKAGKAKGAAKKRGSRREKKE